MAFEDLYNKDGKAEDHRRNSLVSIAIFLLAALLITIVLYNKLDEYFDNQRIAEMELANGKLRVEKAIRTLPKFKD